jgi:hypothetical protein
LIEEDYLICNIQLVVFYPAPIKSLDKIDVNPQNNGMVDDLDDILALPFIERLLEAVLQKIMKDSFNVIEISMTVPTSSID